MFQMTKIASYKILTFPYNFDLLKFHLFDTSYHLTIIYQQIQLWTDEIISLLL